MKQSNLHDLYPQNKLLTMMWRLLCYTNKMLTTYDAHMSVIKRCHAKPKEKKELFDTFVQERYMDMCSSLVNYHPKLIRVENMTCVVLICAVCVIKLVKSQFKCDD